MKRIEQFLIKHPVVVVAGLFLAFLLLTSPGISWGAPAIWHPDELIRRVIAALDGKWRFDETNFNYPSLPKYVMYGLGLLVYKLGYGTRELIIAARLLTVILGGMVVVLTFFITQTLGYRWTTGVVAATLLITNHQISLNARWAHNDIYVTFFVTLAVYLLVKYHLRRHKLWLYAAFFTVGLAASSKYNGGFLLAAPVLIYLLAAFRQSPKNVLEIFETLFIGFALSFMGYALGTPKAALWLAYYLKRLIPDLQRQLTYDRTPDSRIGLLRQWGFLRNVQGLPVFLWTAFSFIAVSFELIQKKIKTRESQSDGLVVILVSLLSLEVPIILSYNLQARYFLLLLPLGAVLSAVMFEKVLGYLGEKGYQAVKIALVVGLGLTLAFNLLKVLAVTALFQHDSRIAASAYIQTLQPGTRIESTQYAPAASKRYFASAHNYPLVFKAFPNTQLPVSPFYEFNVGEAGVEERKPDYLVLDSFTYDRFADLYTCSIHQADCDFFERLRAGETQYELIQKFSYKLPSYLPDPGAGFLNPDIEIYQRQE